MNRVKIGIYSLILGCFSMMVHAMHPVPDSPEGFWKTIDDVTGKPKSIIKIWKAENNLLMGKVVKLYSSNSKEPAKLCEACQGTNHKKPIVGMIILSGLKINQHQWENGKILDPENGKIYSCSVRVAENGNKLKVRGYLGIPLLGRSQMWERVDLMSSK